MATGVKRSQTCLTALAAECLSVLHLLAAALVLYAMVLGLWHVVLGQLLCALVLCAMVLVLWAMVLWLVLWALALVVGAQVLWALLLTMELAPAPPPPPAAAMLPPLLLAAVVLLLKALAADLGPAQRLSRTALSGYQARKRPTGPGRSGCCAGSQKACVHALHIAAAR